MNKLILTAMFVLVSAANIVTATYCAASEGTGICRTVVDGDGTRGFCDTSYIDGQLVKSHCENTDTGQISDCTRTYSTGFWPWSEPTVGDWSCTQYDALSPNPSP
jgi:hypothetical protein